MGGRSGSKSKSDKGCSFFCSPCRSEILGLRQAADGAPVGAGPEARCRRCLSSGGGLSRQLLDHDGLSEDTPYRVEIAENRGHRL
jgi:hypothetical protein